MAVRRSVAQEMAREPHEHLFTPGVITPSQFVDERRSTVRTGFQRLSLALIESALVAVVTGMRLGGQHTEAGHRALYGWHEALDWFRETGGPANYAMPFSTACAAVGLEEEWLAAKVLAIVPPPPWRYPSTRRGPPLRCSPRGKPGPGTAAERRRRGRPRRRLITTAVQVLDGQHIRHEGGEDDGQKPEQAAGGHAAAGGGLGGDE